jgi:phosphoribosylamine--glycine ligase
MNILLLGSGGREHTFAWKIAQSPLCSNLFIAPGNAGTDKLGVNVDLNVLDFDAIAKFCSNESIQMIVVGPEAPLVEGIADYFSENTELQHIQVVGPNKKAAQLEGSKAFSKVFMEKYNIPTARYKEFTNSNAASGKSYIDQSNTPIVLKADGLAAGKGVLILDDKEEAKRELDNMLGGKFGSAGNTVVIEEFLDGIEFSVFVLTNGKEYVILPEAKDYKRIGEGDTGLNTGGMGAVSPVPFVDEELMNKVRSKIIEPTVQGLIGDNIHYEGFIFFGLIKVGEEPMVIEYNCRMGDPETEVVIPRLKNDLLELFVAMKDGTLGDKEIEFESKSAATVMLVSGGYPEAYEKGKVMSGVDMETESILFHAGTKKSGNDIVTNGGRVLAITSLADSKDTALEQSKSIADQISFEGKYYRTDIGFDL